MARVGDAGSGNSRGFRRWVSSGLEMRSNGFTRDEMRRPENTDEYRLKVKQVQKPWKAIVAALGVAGSGGGTYGYYAIQQKDQEHRIKMAEEKVKIVQSVKAHDQHLEKIDVALEK